MLNFTAESVLIRKSILLRWSWNRTMKQVQCRAGQPPGCRKFRMLSVVLLLTRGSLHCIVPNDEIMKFNKWSVVKFIFHRLVRYLCFPDLQGWSISHLPSAVRHGHEVEPQGATVTTTVDGKAELTGLIRDARCKSVDINNLCLARSEHWFKGVLQSWFLYSLRIFSDLRTVENFFGTDKISAMSLIPASVGAWGHFSQFSGLWGLDILEQGVTQRYPTPGDRKWWS